MSNEDTNLPTTVRSHSRRLSCRGSSMRGCIARIAGESIDSLSARAPTRCTGNSRMVISTLMAEVIGPPASYPTKLIAAQDEFTCGINNSIASIPPRRGRVTVSGFLTIKTAVRTSVHR